MGYYVLTGLQQFHASTKLSMLLVSPKNVAVGCHCELLGATKTPLEHFREYDEMKAGNCPWQSGVSYSLPHFSSNKSKPLKPLIITHCKLRKHTPLVC